MARPDRNAIVQAAMSRGGQGSGGSNLGQALAQFQATFSQAMEKMVTQIGKAQEAQAMQAQQDTARVADAAERSYNQAQQKAETQRQEERQDVLTQEGRQYQMQVADYHTALQQQVQQEAQQVSMLIQQQESAKERILADREKSVATIAGARLQALKWIDSMDANNHWDALPNGIQTREMMLDLARMSEVVNEDYNDSAYSDKLHTLVAQTQQAILGGEDFTDITGESSKPPMLPVPASMLDSIGLDLPILTREEMKQWEDRNGYPKGGVWALKTDDPKLLLVNPVGFSALMAAKQQDTALAVIGSQMVQRDVLLEQAKKQREWDAYAGPLEDARVELAKQFNLVAPDAIAASIAPFAPSAAGLDTQPDDVSPAGMVKKFYSSVMRKPDVVERAMMLGLPEDDVKRWIPGQPPMGGQADPAASAEDFFVVQQIQAADDVISDHIETGYGDPKFRANVAAWIGKLPNNQVFQIGLSDDVANKVLQAKTGAAMYRGSAGVVPSQKLMEQAVSQVITAWRSTNRDTISIPVRNNNVMQVYRDSNHAAAVLQDATAMAVLSRMEPSEIPGNLPLPQLPDAEGQGMFRAPLGVLQSLNVLNNRPSSRRALKDYTSGGLGEEEKKLFDDPRYNQVKAYYENVSKTGIVKTPDGKPVSNPYESLTNRVHASRVRSKTATAIPEVGQMGMAGAAQQAGPEAAAQQPGQMGGAAPAGQPSQPSMFGSRPRQFSDETSLDVPITPNEPAQLAPQPVQGQ